MFSLKAFFHRLPRRAGVVLALLALFLGGAFQAKAAGEERILRVGMAALPDSLDPHARLQIENIQYANWAFDSLMRWTPAMRLEGRLAERWEQIDPVTWRFRLRPGARFHSGNPVTADDVIWSLERLQRSPEMRGLFEVFAKAKKQDEHTVDLVTKRPYALVLNVCAYLFVMDSKFYMAQEEAAYEPGSSPASGLSFSATHASGSGPFAVSDFTLDKELRLSTFAGYWGEHGNLTGVEIRQISDGTARVNALKSGEVDFIMPVPVEHYANMRGPAGIRVEAAQGSRVLVLQMNQERRPEFRDKRVREAVIFGTDTQKMVRDILNDRTLVATQQIPRYMNGYVPSLRLRFHPDQARALLEEAGHAEGLTFSMLATKGRYSGDEQAAKAFVGMMADIGVTINLTLKEAPAYWDDFDAQVADIQMVGWQPDTEDGANYSEAMLMCPNSETGYGYNNSGNYCNPELDALVMKVQLEPDPIKRIRLLRSIETMAYDDAAFIPLYFDPYTWAAGPALRNFERIVNNSNQPDFGKAILE